MELRDYLGVIRSRAGLIVACGLVVMLTTVVASMQQAPTYRSGAEILISDQNAGTALLGDVFPQLSDQPERYLQTAANVMTLRSMLEKVIAREHLQMTPEELRRRLKVTAVPQTSLIGIEVEDTSASRAASTANAIADIYVAWVRDLKRRSIRAAADEVNSRLGAMQVSIGVLRTQRVAAKDAVGHQAEIDAAITRQSALAERYDQLLISEQLEVGPASVVSRAVADDEKVAPKPLQNGALALVVGLLLGTGIAFLLEHLDNTIKSAEDAEMAFGAPVLGWIPLDPPKAGEALRLSVVDHPGGCTAEAYRLLRNGLSFVNFEHAVKTVLVTSATPEEGKSTVAANLAAVLSLSGKRTILVECDFRRSTIDERFGLTGHVGLSDVLAGAVHTGRALQRNPELENLWLLSAGSTPPNPSELLGSLTMQRLLGELAEQADWIILDTPPVLAVADTSAVAPWVDGVLMVAAAGSTTHDMARRSQDMLRSVGARLAGVVVWGDKSGREDHSYLGRYGSPPQSD